MTGRRELAVLEKMKQPVQVLLQPTTKDFEFEIKGSLPELNELSDQKLQLSKRRSEELHHPTNNRHPQLLFRALTKNTRFKSKTPKNYPL